MYVGSSGCEDGTHCLDLKCPLNKTTAKTFKEYKEVDTEKKLQGLCNHVEEFHNQINLHESLHTHEEGIAVYYEKPLLTVKRKW